LAAVCVLSACASSYKLSDQFQKTKSEMTRAQANLILSRAVQASTDSGGFCAVAGYESIPGPIQVENGTIHFPANKLIPIESHLETSGDITSATGMEVSTVTTYKRIPGRYEVDLSHVREVSIYLLKDMVSKTGCGARKLPLTDYRLVFQSPEMKAAYFHIYTRPEQLEPVLAALSVYSPEISFR